MLLLAATLLLSEVRLTPAESAPAFVEIVNAGEETMLLEGWILRNERNQTRPLPESVEIEPGEFHLVTFDGEWRAFITGNRGAISISKEGQGDGVAWGSERPGAVSLCGGGRCGDPPAGSVIARLPGRLTASDASAWAVLQPDQATPKMANRRPRVSFFAALPGMIFPGRPTFSWYGVRGATRYRVQVARDENFSEVVFDEVVAATASKGLVQETVEGPQLPAGDYFWRVQALSEDEPAEGEVSRPMPFSVGRRPVAVAQLASLQEPPAQASPDVRNPPPLAVPRFMQRKDTAMLMLEAISEKNPKGWDTPDPVSSRPYCARTAIANIAALYGAKLSQDRIGYQAFKDEADGPELDLPETGMRDYHTNPVLKWAFGPTVTYKKNPANLHDPTSPGADWSACPGAQECPGQLAFRYGFRMIEDIKSEIDAGRPLVASTPGHVFVISGYAQQGTQFVLLWHDSLGTIDTKVNGSGLAMGIDSYWIGVGPRCLVSDEPDIRTDVDQDGVVDFDERVRFKTISHKPDSDDDGISDKREIRASVFDPEHGYARDQRDELAIEDIAALAHREARDSDGDKKAMELDLDSDGGGCDDGQEDANRDGVRDGPESSNFVKGDDVLDERGKCVDLWLGTVEAWLRLGHDHTLRMTAQVRMREVDPKMLRIPVVGAVDYMDMVNEGSTVKHVHRGTGSGCVMSGEGTAPTVPEAGTIERQITAVGANNKITWSAWRYILSFHPVEGGITWYDRCPQQSWTHDSSGWGVNLGAGDDPEVRTIEDGRMYGTYVAEQTTVSWSICRAGAQCPPPPPLPPLP